MFSSAVKLANLDDFLQSSQDCVKPIVLSEDTSILNIFDSHNVSTERPDLIKEDTAKRATVNLNDCLACSGCVTSAEADLMEQHSHLQLLMILQNLKSVNALVTMSVSFQSTAALAAYFDQSISTFFASLHQHLKTQGFDYIFLPDLGQFLHDAACLREYREVKPSQSRKTCILSSQCPGVVCYAEKSACSIILDSLSKVPSVQLWQALLHKTLIREIHNLHVTRNLNKWKHAMRQASSFGALGLLHNALSVRLCHHSLTVQRITQQAIQCKSTFVPITSDKVFHVSVEPCYDKKLESLRPEFRIDTNSMPLLDLVLSTDQLLELLKVTDFDPRFDSCYMPATGLTSFLSCHYSSQKLEIDNLPDIDKDSGGHSQVIAQSIVEEMDVPISCTQIQGLNADHQQWRLCDSSRHCVASIHKASGLRNIKNMVTKFLRSRKSLALDELQCVTLLACPQGCLNGAGHATLRNKDDLWSAQTTSANWNKISRVFATLQYAKHNTLFDNVQNWLQNLRAIEDANALTTIALAYGLVVPPVPLNDIAMGENLLQRFQYQYCTEKNNSGLTSASDTNW